MGLVVVGMFFMIFSPSCWAGRASFETSTGKLLEYQSRATAGTLTQNALRAGYTESQIEERDLSEDEWQAVYEDQILKPAEEQQKANLETRNSAKQKLKDLGLTEAEMEALFD